jgi:hypothetical protein
MSPAELTAIVSGAILTAGMHLTFRIPISRALLFTAIVPALILLYQAVLDMGEQQKIYARRFDRQQWMQGANPRSSVRREMIGDLLDKRHVLGMSHQQVVELLGTPDQQFSSNKCISYEVVREHRGIVEECMYFSLEMERGKVQDWRVWQN